MPEQPELRRGVYFALAAFSLWGLAPIYFKTVASVAPLEVLAHRIVWSVLLLGVLLWLSRRWQSLLALLRQRRLLGGLMLSALLISANWGVFIWAVSDNRILETSLGYFINPLVSLLLGMLFLGERLRPAQWGAIALMGIAVGYQLILLGSLPAVALVLAFSFGFYGLVRKKLSVDPIIGLFVETLLVTPLALAYLAWGQAHGGLAFTAGDTTLSLLLFAAGIVTTLPLLCFAAATVRLSLTWIGMFQYLAPSIAFLLAVFYYQEPLDGARMLTFVLIWIALALFTAEGWWNKRRLPPAMPVNPPGVS
ncbi:EamA family transporter RarD [Motiliproteus sediminis]|uniref:EamA family transporter RarD n=1 Tax=Motiliproteus sediminis TaxID=1468178 RepID=UPI001AEFA448|nr:EamA family transporter RarD [Motiliproteus sediminis]